MAFFSLAVHIQFQVRRSISNESNGRWMRGKICEENSREKNELARRMQNACRSFSQHEIFALRACATRPVECGEMRLHFINYRFHLANGEKLKIVYENRRVAFSWRASVRVVCRTRNREHFFSFSIYFYLHFLCGMWSVYVIGKAFVPDVSPPANRNDERWNWRSKDRELT